MFIDEKELRIQAGKGGDGAVLFRREIYVPRGGPDGGDGGNGGSVYLVAEENLHTLSHLANLEKINAEDGKKGGHRRSTGKSGEDQRIAVPPGTVLEIEENGAWNTVTELTEVGQEYLIAKGGSGGWGNWRFRSSVQQAPDRANPGLPGESKTIKLVLKLIADVGLVGLPNAGKSTLLAAVTAARPKIANYPFTTLEPQLGVAQLKGGRPPIVIADLPGLIGGASQGKGLGTAFLKHIERTKSIIHCLDSSAEPDELKRQYRLIRKELASWSPELAEKPERVALTKTDMITHEEAEQKKKVLEQLTRRPVFLVSALTRQGLDALLG
ncbi:GTPase ObgE [Patescibacteria group bacterium]|nr:GTPase ObgE [Patescibacteria group bacterium]